MKACVVVAIALSALGCRDRGKSVCPEPPATAAIPLDLPKAATGIGEPTTTIDIALTTDGAIYFGGARLENDDALRARLREVVGKGPEPQAILRIDQAVPYGRFVSVVDLVRQAGVARYVLSVSPTELPKGAVIPPRKAPNVVVVPPAEPRPVPPPPPPRANNFEDTR